MLPFLVLFIIGGKWFSVTDNPDNEAKWDSSKRGTWERLEIAGSCYDKYHSLGTLSETDQLCVQGRKG